MPLSVGGVSNTGGAANLSLQDFMQVLMAQMSHQNPLQPMDNQEFLAQIAQFTALGQTQEINTNVQNIFSYQATQLSLGLLGRTILAKTASGGTITGSVSNVDCSGTTPKLTLNTASGSVPGITLADLVSVQ